MIPGGSPVVPVRRSRFPIPALAGLACGLAAGCAGSPVSPSFETDRYAAHVRVLASDEFEGRRPATIGEEKTVAYLERAFREAGLQPGAAGSFLQPVPFVELTARPDSALRISGPDGDTLLTYADEAVFWTKRVVPEAALADSELVFVGYGIVEPAMEWNDYAGLDMRGKTAVILVNDPGFATGDPKLFNGRAMTYHGRWTYKFEEAARQGATGAIIVHEEAPAAYPWEVVRNGGVRPQLALEESGGSPSRVDIEGWVTRDAAVRVFRAAGLDYDTAKAAAARRGFRPMPLPLKATARVMNDIRHVRSNNVVGLLPGSKRPQEYVLFTAHWDHLGRAEGGSGDTIFNGAVDNATGTAALIELARAFGEARPAPERSLLFVGFTGEEYGLLGSEYFADHPVVPLAQVAGGLNMDGMAVNGRTRDVTVVGYGASELDDFLAAAAAAQGRVLKPEPSPEKGSYYRSDHFMLARKGVPMLYARAGIDSHEHGAEWGLQQNNDYTSHRYHKPSDEFDPRWDLSGAIEDLQLYFDVGLMLAMEQGFPNWRPGNEFRSIRDRSRAGGAASQ
jgi:Zn-dependent M28 family amino/carboxypeptidase